MIAHVDHVETVVQNPLAQALPENFITRDKVKMAYSGRGPTYKVVLLGELGVGKTSLFKRLKDNSFDEYQTATTGIDSCTKVMKVDGEQVMVRKCVLFCLFKGVTFTRVVFLFAFLVIFDDYSRSKNDVYFYEYT